MTPSIITVDSGTTNTRLCLIENGKIVRKAKVAAGARDTAIRGSNAFLKEQLCSALSELLKDYETPVSHLVASGMIVSENGLYPLPHLVAPASLAELANAAKEVLLPDVSPIPFLFIPGIKTPDSDDPFNLDVMRGEETEAFGILSIVGRAKNAVVISPGSHTKIVTFDEDSRIDACYTAMGGEILQAIAKNTILSSSLPEAFPNEPDRTFLKKGFAYAEKHGLGSAAFRVRVMRIFDRANMDEAFSFLIGAVLQNEITLIKTLSKGKEIILGGSHLLRTAFSTLLEGENVTLLSDEEAGLAVPLGAVAIYAARSV